MLINVCVDSCETKSNAIPLVASHIYITIQHLKRSSSCALSLINILLQNKATV